MNRGSNRTKMSFRNQEATFIPEGDKTLIILLAFLPFASLSFSNNCLLNKNILKNTMSREKIYYFISFNNSELCTVV